MSFYKTRRRKFCVCRVFIFLDRSSRTGLIKFMSLKLSICMIILVLLLCRPKNFILRETHFTLCHSKQYNMHVDMPLNERDKIVGNIKIYFLFIINNNPEKKYRHLE